jgi:hypothetical protein
LIQTTPGTTPLPTPAPPAVLQSFTADQIQNQLSQAQITYYSNLITQDPTVLTSLTPAQSQAFLLNDYISTTQLPDLLQHVLPTYSDATITNLSSQLVEKLFNLPPSVVTLPSLVSSLSSTQRAALLNNSTVANNETYRTTLSTLISFDYSSWESFSASLLSYPVDILFNLPLSSYTRLSQSIDGAGSIKNLMITNFTDVINPGNPINSGGLDAMIAINAGQYIAAYGANAMYAFGKSPQGIGDVAGNEELNYQNNINIIEFRIRSTFSCSRNAHEWAGGNGYLSNTDLSYFYPQLFFQYFATETDYYKFNFSYENYFLFGIEDLTPDTPNSFFRIINSPYVTSEAVRLILTTVLPESLPLFISNCESDTISLIDPALLASLGLGSPTPAPTPNETPAPTPNETPAPTPNETPASTSAPSQVTNGLLLYLDAGNTSSFDSSISNNANWVDLLSGSIMVLRTNTTGNPIPQFNSNYGGYISFNPTNSQFAALSTSSMLSTLFNAWGSLITPTMECWYYNNDTTPNVQGSYPSILNLAKYGVGDLTLGFPYPNASFRTFSSTEIYGSIFSAVGNPPMQLTTLTPYQISSNGWHYYSLSLDLQFGIMTLYVDGNLISQDSFSSSATVFTAAAQGFTGLRAMASYNRTGGYEGGGLAVIRLYNRILSASERIQNYNIEASRFV